MSQTAKSPRSVRVERVIARPPDELWALVSDVTRIGEWSPETKRCAWVGGATGPAVGARFKGTNEKGAKSWSTDCTVTVCEPGKRFAFDVKAAGFKVAGWAYQFEPVEGGCRVIETWDDHRGMIATWIGPLASGTKDRAARNLETMTETLERLAAAAES
jgi:uncharacterized protein YndB with AHSA1/START domain